MPLNNYFVLGDYDATCDTCGRGFKFSALRKRWDNAWVCDADWEPRQPQDFVRAVRDDMSVPVGRPRVGLPSASFYWSSSMMPVFNFYNKNGVLMTWSSNAK